MHAQSQAIQLERNCNTSNCDLFSLAMKSALALFQRTNDYAEDVRQDIWQFAITIGELRQMGLSDSDMRWLLCRGDLLHADEITSVGDSRRTFRSLGIFTLTTSTCFISAQRQGAPVESLSATNFHIANDSILGIATEPTSAENSATELQKLIPLWDDIRHELILGEFVVKRFKHKSRNQESILATFQEDGWPYKVYDPLSPTKDCDPKRRLNDTIKGLNHHQENALIRFRGDGTGEAVVWELSSSANSKSTVTEGLFR